MSTQHEKSRGLIARCETTPKEHPFICCVRAFAFSIRRWKAYDIPSQQAPLWMVNAILRTGRELAEQMVLLGEDTLELRRFLCLREDARSCLKVWANLEPRLDAMCDKLKYRGGAAALSSTHPCGKDSTDTLNKEGTRVQGEPGRRGYSLEALRYALELRKSNPQLKAMLIRKQCLQKFSQDDLPPDPDTFRAWLNRPRKNR